MRWKCPRSNLGGDADESAGVGVKKASRQACFEDLDGTCSVGREDAVGVWEGEEQAGERAEVGESFHDGYKQFGRKPLEAGFRGHVDVCFRGDGMSI